MIYDKVLIDPEGFNFSVDNLGQSVVDSPVKEASFVEDTERVVFPSTLNEIVEIQKSGKEVPSFEKAGPRQKIFHPPFSTRAAIVTCGGLCPGLNSVIKGIVETLHHQYGVDEVFGIPYGYLGLTPQSPKKPMRLDPEVVDTIHEQGGTILGSSRGSQDEATMVDTLVNMKINILFCIGGDGTLKGAHAIHQEIRKRNLNISIIGVPKTIDNDLSFVGRTFGFETAIYHSSEIITSAHMEARSANNGIGLVKLMGRDSGFIAAYAAMANPVVNFCFIPEDGIELEGENGLLASLERRLKQKDHVVIVIAEGVGQKYFEGPAKTDASGNELKKDIGELLKNKINEYFKDHNESVSVKYFDPSYLIRSIPAKGTDAIFCNQLAENAVHAGMAGKTDVVIGKWNKDFTLVPIELAVSERQKVNVNGSFWKAVLNTTRQNYYMHQ